MSLISALNVMKSCHFKQIITPPTTTTEWNVMSCQCRSVYMKTALLSVSTSSGSSIVWVASFFPQMSLPACTVSGSQWLPLCLAATPHWCYATLGHSAFWVFFCSPIACCLRVRGAINKHRAFMVHSCVTQQSITHAAWLVSHSALT